ncbi:MAG: ArnT family glycosyltransferase [Thermoguttaceae bacterium]
MSWRNAFPLPFSLGGRAPSAPQFKPFSAGAELLSPQQQSQWLWVFLAVGLAARLVRYLLRFPLWEDEAMLSANFLDRGYLALLQPLHYQQVAPTLFLWGQLTMVKLFGFSEYTLRLIPLVCSVGSLFLFRRLAGLLLRGTALLAAFGVFAVAYPPIRYTAEAKPYGGDLFLALLMLWMLVRWLRGPGENRWLWALAALIAPAVGYSYPAVFVGGGVSLIVGHVLWTSGRRGWVPWIVFNLLLAGSFLAVLVVSRTAVGALNQTLMQSSWQATFPPLAHPLRLAWWLITTHTGSMMGYPVGGPGGGSTVSFLLAVVGLGLLIRRRQRLLLAILLLPLGLNFVAAALHRFPYGEHMRFALYSATTFCVFIALGTIAPFMLFDWLTGHRTQLGRAFSAVLAVFVLIGCGSIVLDLRYPYKSDLTLRSRDFAQWFWFDLAHESELVCLHTDLKKDLTPNTFAYGWSALYLCNQRIYSPRHARGEPPHLDHVSAERPLRCVVFRDTKQDPDTAAEDRWLAEMQHDYKLVSRDTWEIPIYGKWNARPQSIQNYIEVFKFVPAGGAKIAGRAPSPAPAAAGPVR